MHKFRHYLGMPEGFLKVGLFGRLAAEAVVCTAWWVAEPICVECFTLQVP